MNTEQKRHYKPAQALFPWASVIEIGNMNYLVADDDTNTPERLLNAMRDQFAHLPNSRKAI